MVATVPDECGTHQGRARRKSNSNDAAWNSDLLAQGLIRANFVPPEPVQHTQPIQAVLEDANIKLSLVIADILGLGGRRILK